jgi:alkylhydroperoxidase/carboxymuconolactone decarboxylase family protein YurZ
LPYVGLIEALELMTARFERAVVRWHARYATETAGVTVEEAQAVLALLAALRGPRAPSAAYALAAVLDRRGLERAGEVLVVSKS